MALNALLARISPKIPKKLTLKDAGFNKKSQFFVID